MRYLKITRKKRFFGSVIPYFLFIGYRRIANGQTVTIPIRDEKCCVFVEASTSTGVASSPVYSIDEGTADVKLELVTLYSWTHGSKYLLRPASA